VDYLVGKLDSSKAIDEVSGKDRPLAAVQPKVSRNFSKKYERKCD
jgi:hypothetical protein